VTKRAELVIEADYQPDVSAEVELLRGLLVRLGSSETRNEAFDPPVKLAEGPDIMEAPDESTPA
jgi:hypothetical protein